MSCSSSRGIEKRAARSSASRWASRLSPQAESRCARSAWRTPKRSGAIGPTGRSPRSPGASTRRSRAGRDALALVRVAQRVRARPRPRPAAPSARAGRRARSGAGPSRRAARCARTSVSKTPSSSVPASESVRSTHQAVSSWTAMRAVPTVSPICHGRGTRCASTSNSAGSRKSRSRRVAKRMSLRMRETRNVRTAVAVEIPADDVPDALVEAQRVRVQRPLRHLVSLRRPVRELDRALLGDRGLELREASGELGRVVGCADADALGGGRAGVLEAGPPEREVLEREPQRLRVGELAVEVEERGLQRGELVVLQVEPVEEVVLGAERVELLAGELVALRVERAPRARSARPGRSRTGARTPRPTSPSSPRRCPSRRARSAAAAPPSGTRRGRAAG